MATYYIATAGGGGADINAGTIGSPWATLAKAFTVMIGGDTALMRAGTYAEGISSYTGTINGGTVTNRTIVSNYDGEKVTLKPAAGQSVVELAHRVASYIWLRGLDLDGSGGITADVVKVTYSSIAFGDGADFVKISDCAVRNGPTNGILTTGTRGHEFVRVKLLDNGTSNLHHGLYVQGADVLCSGAEIARNAGYGVHGYDAGDFIGVNNLRIEYSQIHDNARVGSAGCGILFSSGYGAVAYRNEIFGHLGASSNGMTCDFQSFGALIKQNSFYRNNGVPIYKSKDAYGVVEKGNRF